MPATAWWPGPAVTRCGPPPTMAPPMAGEHRPWSGRSPASATWTWELIVRATPCDLGPLRRGCQPGDLVEPLHRQRGDLVGPQTDHRVGRLVAGPGRGPRRDGPG